MAQFAISAYVSEDRQRMSRIDKALETWEKSAAAVRASADRVAHDVHPSSRFELNGYAREDGAAATSSSVSFHSDRQQRAPELDVRSSTATQFVAKPQVTPALEARLVSGGPGPVPLEQYRRLAATLHDVQQQQGLKTLMFASALPGEGKTLTTVNLGLTLSASYERRVLVIDADLRWPSVHKMLGIANASGLSEALQAERFELPIKQVLPRLSVLTAGRPDVTPLAGLTSARMASLVEHCARDFDWVLIDTPPVGLLPDAQLLARLTRAVIFVIGAGVTPAAAVTRAVAELGTDCIIGTVLNRVQEHQIPQAGYYSRYYESADSE
jgi:capsular exopolysaccharide synthesis family protein